MPYTEDPDTTYDLIRRMCTNKNAFMACKSFIDLAQGISLPMNNVRNAKTKYIYLHVSSIVGGGGGKKNNIIYSYK